VEALTGAADELAAQTPRWASAKAGEEALATEALAECLLKSEESEESRGTSMKMLARKGQAKAAAGDEGSLGRCVMHGMPGAEGAAAATRSMMMLGTRSSVGTVDDGVDSVMRAAKRTMDRNTGLLPRGNARRGRGPRPEGARGTRAVAQARRPAQQSQA